MGTDSGMTLVGRSGPRARRTFVAVSVGRRERHACARMLVRMTALEDVIAQVVLGLRGDRCRASEVTGRKDKQHSAEHGWLERPAPRFADSGPFGDRRSGCDSFN